MKITHLVILATLLSAFHSQEASTEENSVEIEQSDQETPTETDETQPDETSQSLLEEPEAPESKSEESEASNEEADESLNTQISSTIQEIQTNLQGEEKEVEGVPMTEDNVGSLVLNLWPSVQNFIEQSLAEVSTLDEMAVDEITEEEAAYIRSKRSNVLV